MTFDRAMPFEATLTNGVPPGEIVTRGLVRSLVAATNPDRHRSTAHSPSTRPTWACSRASRAFCQRKGTFGGRLERIEVHGDTDTPEFTITSVGHAIPLRAKYHAIVDGTNGNTILERIDGSFLNTSLVAKGDVVRISRCAGPSGHPGRHDGPGAAGGRPVAGSQDAQAADDGSAHAPDHHDSAARRRRRGREAAARRQRSRSRRRGSRTPAFKRRSKVSASAAAASCRSSRPRR